MYKEKAVNARTMEAASPVNLCAIRDRLQIEANRAYYAHGPSDLIDALYSLVGHLTRTVEESLGPKSIGVERDR